MDQECTSVIQGSGQQLNQERSINGKRSWVYVNQLGCSNIERISPVDYKTSPSFSIHSYNVTFPHHKMGRVNLIQLKLTKQQSSFIQRLFQQQQHQRQNKAVTLSFQQTIQLKNHPNKPHNRIKQSKVSYCNCKNSQKLTIEKIEKANPLSKQPQSQAQSFQFLQSGGISYFLVEQLAIRKLCHELNLSSSFDSEFVSGFDSILLNNDYLITSGRCDLALQQFLSQVTTKGYPFIQLKNQIKYIFQTITHYNLIPVQKLTNPSYHPQKKQDLLQNNFWSANHFVYDINRNKIKMDFSSMNGVNLTMIKQSSEDCSALYRQINSNVQCINKNIKQIIKDNDFIVGYYKPATSSDFGQRIIVCRSFSIEKDQEMKLNQCNKNKSKTIQQPKQMKYIDFYVQELDKCRQFVNHMQREFYSLNTNINANTNTNIKPVVSPNKYTKTSSSIMNTSTNTMVDFKKMVNPSQFKDSLRHASLSHCQKHHQSTSEMPKFVTDLIMRAKLVSLAMTCKTYNDFVNGYSTYRNISLTFNPAVVYFSQLQSSSNRNGHKLNSIHKESTTITNYLTSYKTYMKQMTELTNLLIGRFESEYNNTQLMELYRHQKVVLVMKLEHTAKVDAVLQMIEYKMELLTVSVDVDWKRNQAERERERSSKKFINVTTASNNSHQSVNMVTRPILFPNKVQKLQFSASNINTSSSRTTPNQSIEKKPAKTTTSNKRNTKPAIANSKDKHLQTNGVLLQQNKEIGFEYQYENLPLWGQLSIERNYNNFYYQLMVGAGNRETRSKNNHINNNNSSRSSITMANKTSNYSNNKQKTHFNVQVLIHQLRNQISHYKAYIQQIQCRMYQQASQINIDKNTHTPQLCLSLNLDSFVSKTVVYNLMMLQFGSKIHFSLSLQERLPPKYNFTKSLYHIDKCISICNNALATIKQLNLTYHIKGNLTATKGHNPKQATNCQDEKQNGKQTTYGREDSLFIKLDEFERCFRENAISFQYQKISIMLHYYYRPKSKNKDQHSDHHINNNQHDNNNRYVQLKVLISKLQQRVAQNFGRYHCWNIFVHLLQLQLHRQQYHSQVLMELIMETVVRIKQVQYTNGEEVMVKFISKYPRVGKKLLLIDKELNKHSKQEQYQAQFFFQQKLTRFKQLYQLSHRQGVYRVTNDNGTKQRVFILQHQMHYHHHANQQSHGHYNTSSSNKQYTFSMQPFYHQHNNQTPLKLIQAHKLVSLYQQHYGFYSNLRLKLVSVIKEMQQTKMRKQMKQQYSTIKSKLGEIKQMVSDSDSKGWEGDEVFGNNINSFFGVGLLVAGWMVEYIYMTHQLCAYFNTSHSDNHQVNTTNNTQEHQPPLSTSTNHTTNHTLLLLQRQLKTSISQLNTQLNTIFADNNISQQQFLTAQYISLKYMLALFMWKLVVLLLLTNRHQRQCERQHQLKLQANLLNSNSKPLQQHIDSCEDNSLELVKECFDMLSQVHSYFTALKQSTQSSSSYTSPHIRHLQSLSANKIIPYQLNAPQTNTSSINMIASIVFENRAQVSHQTLLQLTRTIQEQLLYLSLLMGNYNFIVKYYTQKPSHYPTTHKTANDSNWRATADSLDSNNSSPHNRYFASLKINCRSGQQQQGCIQQNESEQKGKGNTADNRTTNHHLERGLQLMNKEHLISELQSTVESQLLIIQELQDIATLSAQFTNSTLDLIMLSKVSLHNHKHNQNNLNNNLTTPINYLLKAFYLQLKIILLFESKQRSKQQQHYRNNKNKGDLNRRQDDNHFLPVIGTNSFIKNYDYSLLMQILYQLAILLILYSVQGPHGQNQKTTTAREYNNNNHTNRNNRHYHQPTKSVRQVSRVIDCLMLILHTEQKQGKLIDNNKQSELKDNNNNEHHKHYSKASTSSACWQVIEQHTQYQQVEQSQYYLLDVLGFLQRVCSLQIQAGIAITSQRVDIKNSRLFNNLFNQFQVQTISSHNLNDKKLLKFVNQASGLLQILLHQISQDIKQHQQQSHDNKYSNNNNKLKQFLLLFKIYQAITENKSTIQSHNIKLLNYYENSANTKLKQRQPIATKNKSHHHINYLEKLQLQLIKLFNTQMLNDKENNMALISQNRITQYIQLIYPMIYNGFSQTDLKQDRNHDQKQNNSYLYLLKNLVDGMIKKKLLVILHYYEQSSNKESNIFISSGRSKIMRELLNSLDGHVVVLQRLQSLIAYLENQQLSFTEVSMSGQLGPIDSRRQESQQLQQKKLQQSPSSKQQQLAHRSNLNRQFSIIREQLLLLILLSMKMKMISINRQQQFSLTVKLIDQQLYALTLTKSTRLQQSQLLHFQSIKLKVSDQSTHQQRVGCSVRQNYNQSYQYGQDKKDFATHSESVESVAFIQAWCLGKLLQKYSVSRQQQGQENKAIQEKKRMLQEFTVIHHTIKFINRRLSSSSSLIENHPTPNTHINDSIGDNGQLILISKLSLTLSKYVRSTNKLFIQRLTGKESNTANSQQQPQSHLKRQTILRQLVSLISKLSTINSLGMDDINSTNNNDNSSNYTNTNQSTLFIYSNLTSLQQQLINIIILVIKQLLPSIDSYWSTSQQLIKDHILLNQIQHYFNNSIKYTNHHDRLIIKQHQIITQTDKPLSSNEQIQTSSHQQIQTIIQKQQQTTKYLLKMDYLLLLLFTKSIQNHPQLNQYIRIDDQVSLRLRSQKHEQRQQQPSTNMNRILSQQGNITAISELCVILRQQLPQLVARQLGPLISIDSQQQSLLKTKKSGPKSIEELINVLLSQMSTLVGLINYPGDKNENYSKSPGKEGRDMIMRNSQKQPFLIIIKIQSSQQSPPTFTINKFSQSNQNQQQQSSQLSVCSNPTTIDSIYDQLQLMRQTINLIQVRYSELTKQITFAKTKTYHHSQYHQQKPQHNSEQPSSQSHLEQKQQQLYLYPQIQKQYQDCPQLGQQQQQCSTPDNTSSMLLFIDFIGKLYQALSDQF